MQQINRKPLDDGEALTPEAAMLSRLLAGRYSCRAYRPDPVPRDAICQMLSLAQMSASWCNSQPWQVIVTEGEGTERFRSKLLERATTDARLGKATMPELSFPEVYRGIYKERQREVGWQLYESVGVAFGDRIASAKQVMENFQLFGAPHALIVTSERDLGTYGVVDTGLYIGTLLLAAQSLHIGMIPQAALAAHSPLIREHFGIPENRVIVLGASFGYPLAEAPANSFRSRRASLEDVVTWVER